MQKDWSPHPKFLAGQYRALADELLEKTKERDKHLVSLLGALSFLGRMEEATDLFSMKKLRPGLERSACCFFLGIGWTRRSEYERAKALFQDSEAGESRDPLLRFFVQQGKAFFLFYTGRLNQSLEAALESRRAALEAGNRWALCIATDGLGHLQVKTGEIHVGLKHLDEAEGLARKIGNQTMSSAIDISRRLYRWEFGLATEPLSELAKAAKAKGPENNYSLANLALELARQLTLRGDYPEAGRVLETAAPAIYASQNRRQELTLNLRLAELAGRKGEFFQARHFLWFSRRLAHREVDASFELAAIGIERKLDLAEGKEPRGLEHWQSLAEFSSTRDRNLKVRLGLAPRNQENTEDKVHGVLQASAQATSLEEQITPLLKAGFLAEASLALGLPPGEPAIVVLPGNLGVFVQKEKIYWRNAPLSSLQFKLLRAFAKGKEVSKEALVRLAWGYAYAPLRHDSMLYAALSSLRKALGEAGGKLLQPTENGYRLEALLRFPGLEKQIPNEKPLPAVVLPPEQTSQLNHRQIEILEWIRTVRFFSVRDCRERFGTSEITALRDIDGLRQAGHVIRTGKARATRYSLASGGK